MKEKETTESLYPRHGNSPPPRLPSECEAERERREWLRDEFKIAKPFFEKQR